jgi:hypothetical protein
MKRLRKNIGKQLIYSTVKKNEILWNKLTKDVKNLYKKNYTPLKKETEDHRG